MSGTQEADLNLLGRAAFIGKVMARYGLGERGAADVPLEERAKSLRAALEELGPTFAKLGQILSTRPDLLPPEFIAELSKLQDDVPPMTEEEVVAVMEEELRVPWEDVFASIDPEPLAAGTIGQVHAATLEGGDRVVVKVQRQGAEEEIMRDLGLLELFAEKAEHRRRAAAARRLPIGDPPSVRVAQARARLPLRGRERRPARRGARALYAISRCRRSTTSSPASGFWC